MAHLVLRVVEGNAAGLELPLDGDVLLGRGAGKPGNLGNDATLSRRHARIHATPDGGLVLEDLGSHNGTRVNGELIAAPRALAAGDQIELGETTLELIAVDPPVEPEPPVSREQATRLGKVPVEPVPVPVSAVPREQATRLGKVPVPEPPVSREQATRLGKVPEPEPEGGWGAHQAPPTRIGKVPEEILEAPAPKDQATRLGRVPEAPARAADEQATRLAPVPSPATGDAEGQATRLGKVPSAGLPLEEESVKAGAQSPRPRWWKRIIGR